MPMAGSGKRFVDKGYLTPKPLIKVEGKPVIEYVINLFPGEDDFIFICNNEHLKKTNLKKILKSLKPKSKIIGIQPHKKGPVYSLTKSFAEIKDNEQIVISYCDFNACWDYSKFKKIIKNNNCDGAIPCYKGFHPHLLNKNFYAGVLANDKNYMLDIREKHCFTKNPMNCYQSCGIYYFKKGLYVKKYSKEIINLDINLDGEYYVSMLFYLYKRDKLKVYVPEIKMFVQWGTPEDLEEYEAWSRYMSRVLGRKKKETTIPINRKPDYKIRLDPNSKEYKMTYKYWKKYFESYKNKS